MGYCTYVDGVSIELRHGSVSVGVETGSGLLFGDGGEVQSVEFDGVFLGRLVSACVKVGLTGAYDREAVMSLVKQREDTELPEDAEPGGAS